MLTLNQLKYGKSIRNHYLEQITRETLPHKRLRGDCDSEVGFKFSVRMLLVVSGQDHTVLRTAQA